MNFTRPPVGHDFVEIAYVLHNNNPIIAGATVRVSNNVEVVLTGYISEEIGRLYGLAPSGDMRIFNEKTGEFKEAGEAARNKYAVNAAQIGLIEKMVAEDYSGFYIERGYPKVGVAAAGELTHREAAYILILRALSSLEEQN